MKPVQCYAKDVNNNDVFQPQSRNMNNNPNHKDYHNYKSWKLDHLLGAIVIPTDGSWTLTLTEGKLGHELIAYSPKQKQWKVVAVDGRFPTAYGDSSMSIHNPEDEERTNDVMMIALDNPNEIAFIKRKQLKVVTPAPRPEFQDPNSPHFNPNSLPSDWVYTTEQMMDILKAKQEGRIVWIWSNFDNAWNAIEPDHPTQFDFYHCYYTATKPESVQCQTY